MGKVPVQLNIDEDVWKNYQIYCIQSNEKKIASHEVEKFMKKEVQNNASDNRT